MDREKISSLIEDFDQSFRKSFSQFSNFEIRYKPSKQEVFTIITFRIEVKQPLTEIMERLKRWDGEFRKTFKPYTLALDYQHKNLCLSYNFFQSYLKMEKESIINEEYVQIVKDALTKVQDQLL
ncbi:MAG: hypothetical protein VYD54_05600 [Bdellovibrionota bacterium]|nr:hypothetical protein [Bdellovibrionota bacterium]